MAIEAFDFAEQFQTPVFVMTDLDLGMNNWMADPFAYPEKPIERGKVLTAEDLERLGGFARYKDVDGDGVGYRTLPGTNHPAAAYFTRGSGHNEKAQYTEREDDYINNMDRLGAQVRGHAQACCRARSSTTTRKPKIGFIAIGTSDYAVRESCDQLRKRVRHRGQLPAPAGVSVHRRRCMDFIRRHDRVYVVDQNRDAQLLGADAAGARSGR